MGKDKLGRMVAASVGAGRVAALLSDVERLRQEYSDSSWNRLSPSFYEIAAELAIWRKDTLENNAATASQLNIFDLLKVVNLERYHTRFLGDLLDPNGNHGQGKLFLNIFADRTCPPLIRSSVHEADDVITSIEYDTYFGRLDILIGSALTRFLIVIENKIGTTDAPDQLDRYCKWLDRQTKVDADRRLILYLTPEGDRSLYKSDGYIPISYKTHVSDWLRGSMAEAPLPPKLTSLLHQYAEIIAML